MLCIAKYFPKNVSHLQTSKQYRNITKSKNKQCRTKKIVPK